MLKFFYLMAVLAADDDSVDPIELGAMQVTAGRIEQSTFDAAPAVSVVTRDDIFRQKPKIPVDALRGLPGVFVQQTTPGQGIPIVRGLKGSEILHLVNGFRLNNAFFRNAPNQYISLVDINTIDRVEVLRGPASTLYGADAMGGVVNFLTTRAQLEWQRGVASGFYLSADDALGASIDYADGGEDFGWRIGGSYLDTGDRDTGDGTVGPSAYESRSASAGLTWKSPGGGQWWLDLASTEQPSTPRIDELVPGFGQSEAGSDEFFFEPNRRDFALLEYGQDLDANFADNMKLQAGWQRLTDDRRARDSGSTTRRLEENSSDLFGVVGQLQRSWTGGQLVYGLEYYTDEVDSRREEFDLGNGSLDEIDSRYPTGSEQTSLGAFVQNEWFLGQGSLTTGLRYSRFDVQIADGGRGLEADLDFDQWTANIGWTRHLTQRANLVINLGQGFRAPNIFDLATLGERPGNRFNVANPDLSPEELLSLDVGVKWSSADTEAELFGYVARFDDKIASVVTGDVINGRTVVRSENLNRVNLHGIESGVRHRLADQWFVSGAVNWTWGEEIDPAGNAQAADRVPPLSGELGLNYVPDSFWTARLYSRFASEQTRLSDRDRGDPRIDPTGTDGWATLNLDVDLDVGGWDLGAGISNLFDISYREHGSGIDATGRSVNLSFRREW